MLARRRSRRPALGAIVPASDSDGGHRIRSMGRAIRFGCLAAFAALGLVSWAGGAIGQEPGSEGTEAGQPPESIRPGTRIAYWFGTGSRQSRGSVLVPDPKGPIKDDKGHRWRVESRGSDLGGEDVTSFGSMGILVWDVVAVEGDGVLLDSRGYGQLEDGLHESSAGGRVVDPGTGLGLWIERSRLVHVREGQLTGDERIGPWPLPDGRKLEACLYVDGGPNGHSVYDLATGIQVVDSLRASKSPGMNVEPDGTLTPATRDAWTLTYIKALRQTAWPWAKGRMPDWVGRTRALRYRGSRATRMEGVPPLAPSPVLLSADLNTVGETGATYLVRTFDVLDGRATESTRGLAVTGIASLGGYWVDPKGLAGLESGTALDRDPVTGVQVLVGNRVEAPNGAALQFILERGTTFQHTYGYDMANGVLAVIETSIRLGVAVNTVHLELEAPPK